MIEADSLDRMTRDQILAGPTEVKQRDQPMPQFAAKPRPAPAELNHTVWQLRQQPGPTKPYMPATFNSLCEAGKIATNEAVGQGDPRRTYLPGYTGFVRGRQHISGRTFGETSRMASDINYTEHVVTSPIPSDPQKNRKIPHLDLEERFMYGVTNKHAPNHIPGYTGHVPCQRASYAKTFGSSTKKNMKTFSENHQRRHAQERNGYAHTIHARDFLHIDSNPLPGDITCIGARAPQKVLPAHLKYVQYFAL
jgi:hypothetical protein